MATAPFNYVGNPDYRGYLQNYVTNGFGANDPNYATAAQLINFAGNDGNLDMSKVNSYAQRINPSDWQSAANEIVNNNNQMYSTYQKAAGGSGTTSSDTAQYDQAIGQYQGQLDRLPAQLAIAQGNVNTQATTKGNELQSAYNQAQNTYNQNSGQNSQQYVTNKNQINDTASAGLRGLLRTLGAYGAGGGSDAQFVAPNAVASKAAQDRAGAGQNFGQNQQQLDTSFGNYGIDYGNQKKQLDDWKQQQLNSAEQSSLSSKQSILQQLAQLRSQRDGGSTASAQPYLDQASALQPQIDQLGAFNPTYNGTTPVYNAPSVASYTADPNATTQVDQSGSAGGISPYLQMLLGKNKKQQFSFA